MKNLIPKFIAEQFKQKNYSGKFIATTMFLDISGFTAMTQALMKNGKEGAEILTEVINEVFTPSIDAIYKNNGFVSIFAGDAFTSIFPIEKANVLNALSSALEINKIFERIGIQKTKFGDFQLSVKIGLSIGEVEWAIIQNEKQNSYYFRGDAINNCAYSEHNCQQGEIVFDKYLLDRVEKEIEFIQKAKNYYLLKRIDKMIPLNSNKATNSAYSTAKNFIPKAITDLKIKGEFRDIISCFVSFAESLDFDKNISQIIGLANQFGGYFNKIDFGDKGGVMLILFGAPSGKEKLFKRACDFALSVRNLNCQDFKTRIGLTFGTAFAGFIGNENRAEYTALGMVVNLSARFMMKAGWNEIYIDRFIQISISNQYSIKELSQQSFKGFKDKIPVFILEKKIEYRIEFEGKLIGRQKELQKLKRTLKPIQNNKFGGIVYVHGIAGIGKSRLVNELKGSLQTSDHKLKNNWFYLPCDEILRKSFNPFTRFLKEYFKQSEENSEQNNRSNFENKLKNIIKLTKDKDVKSELIRTKSILGAMINLFWSDSLYEQLSARSRFENTLYAVKNLIKAESLQNPMIMELEDGHWIDSDSLKLLRVLITNIEEFPIIIISTCRFNDDGSLFNFNLGKIPESNILLKYLDENGSIKLIENKLGGKGFDSVNNLIWQKSEGNPFYIEQIILYLLEKKLIDENLNLAKDDFEIPKTINAIIIARIDRLTASLKELVQTASVLGREFAVNILSAMLENREIHLELTEGEKENIWNTLTKINVIFKHALIRETVYEMQLKQRLRKLHKLAAETIENLHMSDLKQVYDELANHYENAEISNKAIEYLRKAGDFAKDNFKNEKATGFYNRMLNSDFWELEISERIDTLHKKYEILRFIGKWKESEILVKESIALSDKIGDKKRLGKSNGLLGQQFWFTGNYNEAVKYHKICLAISEKINHKTGISEANGSLGLVYSDMGNYEKAMEHYNKHLKLSKELEDKKRISGAFINMGILYKRIGDYDKAMEFFNNGLKMAEEIGQKEWVANATASIGSIFKIKGNYKEAMKCFEKLLNFSTESGHKIGITAAYGNMGNLYYAQGNYKEAMKKYEEYLKLAEELGDKNRISTAIGNMGNIYEDSGDDIKAMKCFKELLALSKEIGSKVGIASAVVGIGSIYKGKNDYKNAMKYFNKYLKISEELGDKRRISMAFGNLGNIYADQGIYKKAMKCYKRKLEICEMLEDKSGISTAIGNMGILYMDLGDFNNAIEYYKKDLRISMELGDKNGISRSTGNLGNAFMDQGNYENAMEYYAEALTIAKEIGAKLLLPHWLCGISETLHRIGKNKEAKRYNEGCIKAAKEVNSKDHIFSSEVLKEKIAFKLSEDHQQKSGNIEILKNLLKTVKEEENIAKLNYELSLMNFELGNKDAAEKYKQKAISSYKKMYEKTPKIEFKKKVEKLETLEFV